MEPFFQVVVSVCRQLRAEPFLVGGTVRDRLLGMPSHDWDFVCRQAQRVAQRASRRLGAKCITLDEQNRIYRVVLAAAGPRALTLDFAELQGKTIVEDLARRDFTINAMASPLTVTPAPIIDPYNGQKDLKKKILRALSRQAFQKDPMRLLRAYRLGAQMSLTLEPRTSRWLKAEHVRLAAGGVARERVREEVLRLLTQPAAASWLARMDADGLLTTIFPELEAGRRVGLAYYGKGGVLKHHLQSLANVEWLLAGSLEFLGGKKVAARVGAYLRETVGGFPKSSFLKLGVLLHDVGKPATAQVIRGRLRFYGHDEAGAQIVTHMLEKLRFSRQESGLIRLWVRHHMRPGNLASVPKLTEKAIARFFRDMGDDGIGMLIVSLGDHYTYLTRSEWGKGRDRVEKTARRLLESYILRRESVLPAPVLNGHILIKKLGLKPGPAIGRLLEAVGDAQAEGKVKTQAEAVAYARKALTKVRRSLL